MHGTKLQSAIIEALDYLCSQTKFQPFRKEDVIDIDLTFPGLYELSSSGLEMPEHHIIFRSE